MQYTKKKNVLCHTWTRSRMGTFYEPLKKMYIAALTSTVHIQSNNMCNKRTRWIFEKFCCYGSTTNIQKINSMFKKMCPMNVSAVFRWMNAINVMRIACQFRVILNLRNISDKVLWRISNGATVPVTKALKVSSVLCENTIAGVNVSIFYLQLTFIQHHLHLKANI
jgi:hypothetical protein